MRAVCVVGARPNFMKVKPVMDALISRAVDVSLVHTGQHYDAVMSGQFLDELGLRSPDYHLGAGSGTHAEQTARTMVAFEPLVEDLQPDVVVVVGDVNSTLACALVGAKAGCLVAHVEAGLRSRDWSMPEEVNRVVVDRVSDYLFAPSADAAGNLRSEGYREDQVHLVGNVMIDSLVANIDRARRRPILGQLGLRAGGYGLVTLHRPSNVDDPAMLTKLLTVLGEVAQQCPLVFPAHPRTAKRMNGPSLPTGIQLLEPLGYLDFLALEASARVVLTDSGGIQEETTALGVACLTLRDTTERPITVEQGTNRVVGRDPERILAEVRQILTTGVRKRCPVLWDGRAAERVADVIAQGGSPIGHRRPSSS